MDQGERSNNTWWCSKERRRIFVTDEIRSSIRDQEINPGGSLTEYKVTKTRSLSDSYVVKNTHI